MSEPMTTAATAPAGAAPDAKRRPKLELSEDARRGTMAAIGVAVSIIAAVAFALSFVSVMKAMTPFFGAASWAVPLLLDVAIAALTLISIGLELNELPGRGARLFSRVLVGYTIWANAEDAHTWAGRGAHCLPPIVFVGMVTIVEGAVRRLVGLSSETRMDKVRTSRWLLAPASTFRLWRRMRLWEITSYRTAVTRAQQQSASKALLREWHGKSWRRSAPRAERLAVRLQGTSERPVAELLTESAESITAAARAAVRPLSEAEQASLLAAAAEVPAVTETALPEAEQVPAPVAVAPARKTAAKTSPAALARRTAPLPNPIVRRTDDALMPEARALNAQVIEATGTPAGISKLKDAFGVGSERARRLRDLLAAELLAEQTEESTAEASPIEAEQVTGPQSAEVYPLAVVDVLPAARVNGEQVPVPA